MLTQGQHWQPDYSAGRRASEAGLPAARKRAEKRANILAGLASLPQQQRRPASQVLLHCGSCLRPT
jgi:hypothetical protein